MKIAQPLSRSRKVTLASTILTAISFLVVASALSLSASLAAQQKVVWSAEEQPVMDQIRGLRAMPDDARARATKSLALAIRKLPATPNKVRLAYALATLSTEGDFGHDTLQEVATTLAAALREEPIPAKPAGPPAPP